MTTALPIFAAPGNNDWNVIPGKENLYATYTKNGSWDSNLSAGWDDQLNALEPGDKISLQVALKNDYAGDTLWYMKNSVIKTLEQRSSNSNTHGGGYTYVLSYTDPTGKTEDLFNSDVGGEGNTIRTGTTSREGLLEATNNLEDYFYLDTFKQGQSGKVTLTVSLDGESQGNWYQDTEAQLEMQFGVEKKDIKKNVVKQTTKTTNKTRTVAGKTVRVSNNVKTGDPFHMLPYIITMAVSGLIILIIAIWLMQNRRRERAGR